MMGLQPASTRAEGNEDRRFTMLRGVRSLLAVGAAAALVACGGGSQPAADITASQGDSAMKTISAVSPVLAMTQRDAVRLADQATFGASESLLASMRAAGAEAWVFGQLGLSGSRYTSGGDDSIHKPVVADFCAGRGTECARDYFTSIPLLWDFYRNALGQPDQLRQRMALALSQIFVVSALEVDGTYGFRAYHGMLLENAFSNYRELLRRVTLSPLMGEYLNNVNNDRFRPNENFAREMLQLFTVGPCLLNLDGTVAGGSCRPTFDNAVVRAHAYALTGWTYPPGGTAPGPCWPVQGNCRYLAGDMVARTALQDDQPRLLLGGRQLPATRTPPQALDLLLDAVMAHPNTAPFVGAQLIQQLVKSNPSPAYVKRVAVVFNSGRFIKGTRTFGSGQRGDLAATVAAVLLDGEARNTAAPLLAEKLREPVLMMTGVLRALGGSTDGDAMGWWWGEEMRQHLFRAPSVFNFYPPNYPVAGTRLVGPTFGIYNANTAFARLNFVNQLIYWGGMPAYPSVPGAIGTHVELGAFRDSADDAVALVDRLAALATGGRMSTASKSRIVAAVNAWGPGDPAGDPAIDWRAERVRTAAYLVFASPAYQVID